MQWHNAPHNAMHSKALYKWIRWILMLVLIWIAMCCVKRLWELLHWDKWLFMDAELQNRNVITFDVKSNFLGNYSSQSLEKLDCVVSWDMRMLSVCWKPVASMTRGSERKGMGVSRCASLMFTTLRWQFWSDAPSPIFLWVRSTGLHWPTFTPAYTCIHFGWDWLLL